MKIRRREGDSGDLIETQSALDHESQATTRAYVHTVAVKKDKHSNRIARRIGQRRCDLADKVALKNT